MDELSNFQIGRPIHCTDEDVLFLGAELLPYIVLPLLEGLDLVSQCNWCQEVPYNIMLLHHLYSPVNHISSLCIHSALYLHLLLSNLVSLITNNSKGVVPEGFLIHPLFLGHQHHFSIYILASCNASTFHGNITCDGICVWDQLPHLPATSFLSLLSPFTLRTYERNVKHFTCF